MKTFNNRNGKPIIKVSNIITGSLAGFLMVGLSGCDSNPSCRDLRYAPQWKIEECRKNHTQSSSWIPIYSNSSNSYAGTTGWVPSANKLPEQPTSSTKKSGFFSGSSSSNSSGG